MKPLTYAFVTGLLFCACSPSKTNDEVATDSVANTATEQVEPNSAKEVTVEAPITDPKHIVDYYKLLVFKQKVDPFVFTERQGKWVCTENMGEEFDYQGSLTEVRVYPSTVDIKNGYLEIEDEGTGEGAVYTQLALFRKSDKSYLVALCYYSHGTDASVLSGSPPKFFTWNGQDFSEVTKEVFPETPPALFFSSGQEPSAAETYFTLPQQGRTIGYYINKPGNPADSAALKKSKIEITFDSSSDKFVIK